jgi:hypothetical protein
VTSTGLRITCAPETKVSLSQAQQLRQRKAGRRRQDPGADTSDIDVAMPAAKLATDVERAIDRYIRTVVDAAPPLTAEQRDRLALLRPSSGDLPDEAA